MSSLGHRSVAFFIKFKRTVNVCEYNMDKFEPICENRSFQRLYKRGKSFVGKTVVSYVRFENHGKIMVGITTGKKIGNSVCRSRSRRVIREAFRILVPRVKSGVSIVFVARGRTPYVKSTDVLLEMTAELKKAGALKDD